MTSWCNVRMCHTLSISSVVVVIVIITNPSARSTAAFYSGISLHSVSSPQRDDISNRMVGTLARLLKRTSSHIEFNDQHENELPHPFDLHVMYLVRIDAEGISQPLWFVAFGTLFGSNTSWYWYHICHFWLCQTTSVTWWMKKNHEREPTFHHLLDFSPLAVTGSFNSLT